MLTYKGVNMNGAFVRVCVILILLVGSSHAADITWLPVGSFADDGFEVVFEQGEIVEAVNTTTSGIILSIDSAVRGETVSFLPVHDLQTSTTGDAQFSPPTTFADENFNSLLGSHSWGPAPGDEFQIGKADREYNLDLDQDPNTTDDVVLTDGGFENLIVGNQYAIQIFGVYDGRDCCAARETVFSDGRGIDFASDKVTRGDPEYVVGVFTADDIEQTIEVIGHPDSDTDPTLSAYIVFDVTDGGDPVDCDFDDNGSCDPVDIDALMNEVAAGTNNADFDLNQDTVVDDGDRDTWLAEAATANGLSAPYDLGDANLDLRVNVNDLNEVGLAWLSDNNNWTNGNFTGGGVGAPDLNEIGINWQKVHPDAPIGAAVPEPTGVLLLVLGLLGFASVRR